MTGKKQKKFHRISEWFEWNRGEQRGMLVMIVLIGLTIVWRMTNIAKHRSDFAEVKDWELEVRSWLEAHYNQRIASKELNTQFDKKEEPSLFPFNPNTLDDDGWTKLGFTPGQIRSIRKYLNGGGAFRVKGDVAKMYVIDDEAFARIEPFILIPDEISGDQSKRPNEPFDGNKDNTPVTMGWAERPPFNKRTEMMVELNAADTNQLVRMRGIGPWLARKIVEHRERLGGYYDLNQLLEIYRMTPEKLDTLKKNLTLDKSLMRIRNINLIGEEELRKFPYISATQAKALIAYREKHGPFEEIGNLKKCVAIDEKTYEKLEIYFAVH